MCRRRWQKVKQASVGKAVETLTVCCSKCCVHPIMQTNSRVIQWPTRLPQVPNRAVRLCGRWHRPRISRYLPNITSLSVKTLGDFGAISRRNCRQPMEFGWDLVKIPIPKSNISQSMSKGIILTRYQRMKKQFHEYCIDIGYRDIYYFGISHSRGPGGRTCECG